MTDHNGTPVPPAGDPAAAPAAPNQYSNAPATGEDPGKTLGIVGLVLAFVFTLAGLIVSIIAARKSKAAGFKNTPAKVGIILSIVFLVLGVIFFVLALTAGFFAFDALAEACEGLPAGQYETVDGQEVTCP
ncbi:DUF4190 domain-containing protein [Marisediminicola sp. LYQ134]|uniref:DUF4190 domain-containing protein n=1 Tax=unclassified Marisediminicola TaxID=2618316 RepID=UPI0039835836